MKTWTQEEKDEFARLVAEKRAAVEQKNGLAPGSLTSTKPKLDLTGPSEYDPSKNSKVSNAFGSFPEVDTSWATQSTGNLYTPTFSNTYNNNNIPGFAAQNNTNSGFTPEFATQNTTNGFIPGFAARKTAPATSTYIAKTSLPKIVDINYTQTVEQLKSESSFFNSSATTGLEKETTISLDYYSALQSSDIITSLANFYTNLHGKLSTLKNDFIDFWVKRFQLTPEPLKTLISQNLTIGNDSFYTELSDSIGLLVNSGALIDDATTPFTDYTTGLYTSPNTIPVQMRNKISSTSLAVAYSLSRDTTILMRNNLKTINIPAKNTNPYTNSTTNPAHGMNLITDINTYNIIKTNLNSYYTKLGNNFKTIFSYIQYNSNINNVNGYNPRETGAASGSNQQLITRDYTFQFNVGKFTQTVDFLLRKVKMLLSYKTNQNTIGNITTINS